jgi:hypothetical protein
MVDQRSADKLSSNRPKFDAACSQNDIGAIYLHLQVIAMLSRIFRARTRLGSVTVAGDSYYCRRGQLQLNNLACPNLALWH